MYWINTFQPEISFVKQNGAPMRNGTDHVISSFYTHQFQVRFVKAGRGLEANFTKGERNEVATVTFDLENQQLIVKQTTRYDEIKDKILSATMNQCSELIDDDLSACITDVLIGDITTAVDSDSTYKMYHGALSRKLREYTCNDESLNTSKVIGTYRLPYGSSYLEVNSLLDTPRAKIWYIDNFVTEDECRILEEHGKPLLRKATVAGGGGSSIVSESRKAQQAAYEFSSNRVKDPLWSLYNRVLEIAGHHAGLKLYPEGQEPFTTIQYGINDEYKPHCDGSCDGYEYKEGGRVSTAVLYCHTPAKGGSTVFNKADIFIKPKLGTVIFFSYKGKDGYMDSGFTEHSGCPVKEGEKWITTLWMREGVSDALPWHAFDPHGVKVRD